MICADIFRLTLFHAYLSIAFFFRMLDFLLTLQDAHEWRMRHDSNLREITDLKETMEWKENKIWVLFFLPNFPPLFNTKTHSRYFKYTKN